MRSYMQQWRKRHNDIREQRRFTRALDAVSSETVQNELRAIAQTQNNR
jgi:hypothetical protein